VEETIAYKCSHIKYGCREYIFETRDDAIDHERECVFNPKNKGCPTCAHTFDCVKDPGLFIDCPRHDLTRRIT
jgi:hypothetical protein